jgi:hypothetical protein
MRAVVDRVGNLVCSLMNLADDLQKWLAAHGSIDRSGGAATNKVEGSAVIMAEVDTRAPISAISGVPLPPARQPNGECYTHVTHVLPAAKRTYDDHPSIHALPHPRAVRNPRFPDG